MLVLIGKLPPPIGGVTVHVHRLSSVVEKSGIPFRLVMLNKLKVSDIRNIISARVAHIHVSNPYFQLLLVILLKALWIKTIITFHGNIGRFSNFKNRIVRLSVALVDYPIVLNDSSYDLAKKMNPATENISAFIPPSEVLEVNSEIRLQIQNLRQNHKYLFCTNAYNFVTDSNGNETYQITQIIKVFNTQTQGALIISDPSGNYKKYCEQYNIKISSNILFISQPHDFNSILQLSDCFIRYTTTDGDSLSLKEALYWKKDVIASNVVSRPKGVKLIELSSKELEKEVESYQLGSSMENADIKDGSFELINLYKSLLVK